MENLVMLDRGFWKDKRVLLSGHTGFKGSWLTILLHHLGAKVIGVSLPPETNPSLFNLAGIESLCESHFCDIRDLDGLKKTVHEAKPDVVLHLAAQALVRAGYRNPVETFSTNVMGTANILDSLRGLNSVRVAVMVTTDKVYRNLDHHYPYREDDVLGGHDPYSASKAASEIVVASYREAFLEQQGVSVATARAGNVIGGGDWSEDRLIPDAVRSWQSGQNLEVRRPQSIRPWQHVLEPLYGYLTLVEKLYEQPALAGAYNFGPHTHEAATVQDVIELAKQVYGSGEVCYGDGSGGPYEAGWLALEISKAKADLGISPIWNLSESVRRTMAWYKAQYCGKDPLDLCQREITEYEVQR